MKPAKNGSYFKGLLRCLIGNLGENVVDPFDFDQDLRFAPVLGCFLAFFVEKCGYFACFNGKMGISYRS